MTDLEIEMMDRIKKLETDVARLTANQAKALVGWTVFVAGLTLLLDQVKTWVVTHLRLH